MPAQTTLPAAQRRDLRLVATTTRERNPVRILVLPAPSAIVPHDSRALQDRIADDLAQATWEDAEWR